jgi:hypothetical protein
MIIYHVSQIRVVEREMQEYHENEDAKEVQTNMDVDEHPPTSLLSMNVVQPIAAQAASS